MEMKVCGPGCAACERTRRVVETAIAATGVETGIVKVTDFQQRAMMGVFSTPAVVVNGLVKCMGRVPGQSEVEAWLK